MKGGHKAAHKTTTRKVHFAALMDIQTFKYAHIPENVRKSNLKCGEEVIDEARNKGRKVGIGTITNTNEKL